ncbi:unnamed protein product [Camellia sinensis]
MAKFKSCTETEGIECHGQPCLDVATRWNSIYFLLERALPFQKAFEWLEDEDTHFQLTLREDEVGENSEEGEVGGEIGEEGELGEGFRVGPTNSGKGKERRKTIGPPTSYDWMKTRLYVKFLKLFYNATLRFSGSLYVTCNAFFSEIMLIKSAITELCVHDDLSLKLLAHGMSSKFDKYWGKFDKINLLLFVAIVVDPRYKLKYVQWCLEETYETQHVDSLVNKLKRGLTRLYEWYVLSVQNGSMQPQNMGQPSREMNLDKDHDTDV